jgi:serine protease Do
MAENFDKINLSNISEKKFSWRDLVVILAAGLIGFVGGVSAWLWLSPEGVDLGTLVIERKPEVIREESFHYLPQTTHEEMVIEAANQAIPGVVNIVVTREVTVDPFYGMGWFFNQQDPIVQESTSYGTGFFVSSDGLVLTNKHVVLEKDAEYRVVTSDNESYPARVLARDPVYDLALVEIEGDGFPVLELGDSDKLVPGQTVIAIGNALGQFGGSVSTGIISGLSRIISAYGAGYSDVLSDLIQTDAAINRGNSGGPLLDLNGQVVGVNVAMAKQAQNLGFAIPINQAKRAIRSVRETGQIIHPFLGINYVMVNQEIKEEENLPYGYGALIVRDRSSGLAIVPDSAAEKMGLRAGDLILEFNGEKVVTERNLAQIIQDHDPGDTISLKVWRDSEIIFIEGVLGERKS